jgi:hypothetical protein
MTIGVQLDHKTLSQTEKKRSPGNNIFHYQKSNKKLKGRRCTRKQSASMDATRQVSSPTVSTEVTLQTEVINAMERRDDT